MEVECDESVSEEPSTVSETATATEITPAANETAVTETTSQAAIENASQLAREVSEKEMDDEFLHLSIRVGATGCGER